MSNLLQRIKQANPEKLGDSTLFPKKLVLLLDSSGSMREELPPNRDGITETKWTALRNIVRTFQGAEIFSFSDSWVKGLAEGPCGGTNMAHAFTKMREANRRQFVLITDGMPDCEQRTLETAAGLAIDIIYVGPEPRPEFLDRLANAVGRSITSEDLSDAKALTQRLLALEAKGTPSA